MKTKICSKCKKKLILNQFGKNNLMVDKLQNWCKNCRQIYCKVWRFKNKKEIKKYIKTHEKEIKLYMENYRRKNKQKIKKYTLSAKGIYLIIRSRAKRFKQKFNITKADFIKWYNFQVKKCYYCGRTLEEVKKEIYFAKSNRLTVDRKNNIKGYTLNNIVLACMRCNIIKSNFFNEQQMKKLGKIIRKLS